MPIRKLVVTATLLLCVLLCLGGVLAASRINAIRIGGPMETSKQLMSDLVADILPPPEYILESFFEATVLLREPEKYDFHAGRLAKLQKEYDDRHAFWLTADLDPALRRAITEETHLPASEFWTELNTRFLPAIKARNAAAIEASYARLSDDYARQRAAVDKTVTMATTYQAALKERSLAQLVWAIGMLCAVGAAIFALVGVAYFGLLRRVIQPLGDIVDATTSLAAQRDVSVPHLTRADELGLLAKAVESFRQASLARASGEMREVEQELVTASLGAGLAALKNGDLTRYIEADFPPAYASLKTDYNEALSGLSDMIRLVNHSAGGLSLGTHEIALAATELAQRTESNAATLEETNAALGQISERLKTTSASSISTVQCTDQAIGTVANGRDTARDAVSAMDRVRGSAQGIDSVIEGLDKIAFQTRVLAMNAAVEAGRAGQAGLGFSVVADLVSALAKRAEDEAKRARGQLTATQIEITTAMDAVAKVDGALEAIAHNVAEVNVLVLAMATDNQAQALTVSEISKAVSHMDETTQQNAAMVEQTSAATQKLRGEVRQLEDHAAVFTFAGGNAGGHPRARSAARSSAPARILEDVD